MAEQESSREQRSSWREERREERRKRREECDAKFRAKYMSGGSQMTSGGIWTGLFILLIGVAFLIKATVTDLPHWLFSWQVLLITLGLFIGIRQASRGGSVFASLILILVGGTFLVPEINPDITIRRYIWPVVLIILGLYFIIRNVRLRGRSGDEKKNPSNNDGEVFGTMEVGVEDEGAAAGTFDTKEEFI